MTIYQTVRRVYAYDIDENDFLQYLKKTNPDIEDIQKTNSLRELIGLVVLTNFVENWMPIYLIKR